MYINRSVYRSNSFEKMEMSLISNKTQQYFVDLYDRYGMMLNIDMSSYVYNYEKLSKWLLSSSNVNQDFKQADYLFFPSWGFVFNTDFSVPELHMKSKFGWTGSIIDIRDCGKLCAYYAIHLILKLQKRDEIKSCVCCSIENRWPKQKLNTGFGYPDINYIGFLSFTSSVNINSKYIFRHCEIIKNQDVTSNLSVISKYIAEICEHFKIQPSSYVTLLNNKNSSYPCGSGFLYFSLDSILQTENHMPFEFIFIVDIDELSEACGIALIQKVR